MAQERRANEHQITAALQTGRELVRTRASLYSVMSMDPSTRATPPLFNSRTHEFPSTI